MGWVLGCFVHIPKRGFVTAELRTGLGGGILGKTRPHLGKMRPILAICTEIGQNSRKSAPELGKKN